MNQNRMQELLEKYPFAYYLQTDSELGWHSLPDGEDLHEDVNYRLYPVVPAMCNEPSDDMIERGAVILGKRAIYGSELVLPDTVETFSGWKHFANISYNKWEYSEKLSGKFSSNPMIYCIDPNDPNADEIIELNALKRKDAKQCPFCGFVPDIFDPDFCYPQNSEKTLYTAGCIESEGGCSANVLGRSEYEAIDNWNKRYN
jgi:hypothetical protein